MDYTHPREGTETGRASLSFLAVVDYTHPREGTETLFLALVFKGAIMIILIPARGRKHIPCDRTEHERGLYSSPRGDGNLGDGVRYLKRLRIILIPARGRKHAVHSPNRPLCEDYTHPREGTET